MCARRRLSAAFLLLIAAQVAGCADEVMSAGDAAVVIDARAAEASAPDAGGPLGHLLAARRVLWIGAHPDDEAVAAPLFGELCVTLGAHCTFLVFTRGEGGDCGLAGGVCAPDLATVRERELQRSAALFGAELVQWDLGNEEASTPEEAAANFVAHAGSAEVLVQRVLDELVRVDPDAVVIFDPRNGVSCHPDHRATASIAVVAARRLPSLAPRAVFLVTSRYDGEGLTSDPTSLDLSPWLGYTARTEDDPALLRYDATRLLDRSRRAAWSYESAVLRAHPSQFSDTRVAQFEAAPPHAQLVSLLRLSDARDDDTRYDCR